jgi:transglutaminase-like putative cysteine protease
MSEAVAPPSRPGRKPAALRLSLRALGGQLGEQWERDRRDTLFLMGAVLLAVLPSVGMLPWWASTGFGVLFFWRLGLVFSGRWLPRDSVRWVAAIACTTAVWAEYRTLLGREPGVVLLVLFLGLKLMEMRARRDLFVVIFLCFFLLTTSYFHSQSMLAAAVTLLAVLGLVTAMLTMHFGRREQPIGRRFRSASALLLQSLPIAALMFALFPRVQGPLWGSPDDMPSARTGLSESMQPGGIARLSNSDAIAFRVAFEGKVPPLAQLYWRGPVFGSFDGAAWRELQRPLVPLPLPAVTPGDAPPIAYRVTLEPHQRTWLFALDMPVSAGETPLGAPLLRHDLQLVARERILERVRYDLSSQIDYRAGLNETRLSLQNWLELPPGFNPRTLELAQQWRNQETDDARLVERALAMFGQAPFRYTMSPPLLGRHGVDEFLFETRAGFCEHYASAFVVLMRALDIPARIVTGYHGGEINPVDGYWQVRQADAHAWAEVWLAQRGWVRIDPTAAIAPQRIERGSRTVRAAHEGDETAAFASLRLRLDALSNAWNQWFLSYDRTRQQRLLAALGLALDDWQDLVGLLAAGLALLIGAVALITLHPRRPRDPLQRHYAEFCARLAGVGVVREPHETPLQLLERAARLLDDRTRPQAAAIIALYNRLRFGEAQPGPRDVADLRSRIRAFNP